MFALSDSPPLTQHVVDIEIYPEFGARLFARFFSMESRLQLDIGVLSRCRFGGENEDSIPVGR